MKFILGLVILWCTVNIVTSEELDAVTNDEKPPSAVFYENSIQEPLRLTSFQNLDTDNGLNPSPSSIVIEGIFLNIPKTIFINCTIRMA